MKKVTAIVLALLMVLSLAACGSAASESKTLVMATSADYPPYEFIVLNDKNEQQYVGIDVSVSEAIAADMGKELQIVNMDFDSLMAGLQKGDADIVLAAIEVTEERLEAADFSDPYYTDLPPMILVKADKAGEYTSIESFSGKSVGAQTGTTKADLVTSDMPGERISACVFTKRERPCQRRSSRTTRWMPSLLTAPLRSSMPKSNSDLVCGGREPRPGRPRLRRRAEGRPEAPAALHRTPRSPVSPIA